MTDVAVAQFTAQGPGAPTQPLKVDFNPATLRLTVINTMQDDQQPGSQGLQSVRKSATKLDVELVFDTTETGNDVRTETGILKAMGRPSGTQKSVLPQVTFTWGVFAFKGVIESLQETIDFFSSAGVPLRSTVQVGMQSLELDQVLVGSSGAGGAGPTVAPPGPPGQGATGTATQAGNAAAGRAVAAANGLDSMRFTAGAGLAVSADVQLSGPVGFSASAGIGVSGGIGIGVSAGAGIGISGGAGFGISGGAGIGISGGAGIGVSAGAGIGVSAGAAFSTSSSAGLSAGAAVSSSGGASFSADAAFSAGASAGAVFSANASAGATFSAGTGAVSSAYGIGFTGAASAGVTAAAGAFAGLGVSKSAGARFTLDVDRLRPPVATLTVSVDPSASFDATGRLIASGSAGLRANTGGTAEVSAVAWIG